MRSAGVFEMEKKDDPPSRLSSRMRTALLEDKLSPPRHCSPAVVLCNNTSCFASGFSPSRCPCPEAPPESSDRPADEMSLVSNPDQETGRRLQTPRHASQGPCSILPAAHGFHPGTISRTSTSPLPLISSLWSLGDCKVDCCEPCTPECEDITDECTPDCVQVAVPCLDSCVIPAKDCNLDICPDRVAEYAADNALWATTDWHAHCNIPSQFIMNSEPQFGEDLQRLFDCCPNTYYPQNECCVPLPTADGSTVHVTQQAVHEAGLAALFKSYHPTSPTGNSLSSQSISTAPTPELSSLDLFPKSPMPSSSAAIFACQWGNCGQCFASLAELVGHVNLVHLRLPSSDTHHDHAHGAPACHVAPPLSSPPSQPDPRDVLPCPWSGCAIVPAPVDATSDFNASLCALASHLFYDHLHLPTQVVSEENPFALRPLVLPTIGDSTNSATAARASPCPSIPGSNTPPASLVQSPKGKEKATDDFASPNTHTCGWADCGQTFDTSADLTEHLSVVHVGRGKASYDCHWAGCARHGPKHGFSSKQKVLRHLQSHTGHRPFKCDVCGLDFSEAATLQQHMRRHTQEKPYVCDFPGCGKAFAITGALTIHKRTHNGDKPFKCRYCDRAFSESSNLSKHLRTHTGLRPYACTEPGCDKRFSRPDQVSRHMLVHRKKDKRLSDEKDDEMDIESVETGS